MSNVTLALTLSFDDFNPETLDVSEITELTKSIPKDGNVDGAIAEVLAVKMLRGADRCAEILAKLTWWEARKEDEKRSAYARASLITANEKGIKTATEKKTYAEADPEYLKTCDASNKAKAMKLWFKNKHESLISAHYLMKDIAKGGRSHKNAGSGDLWQ
jgi:hypothetical protein